MNAIAEESRAENIAAARIAIIVRKNDVITYCRYFEKKEKKILGER